MTNEVDQEDLAFELADGFRDASPPKPTSPQWPVLGVADEAPTDVVVLTEALVAGLEAAPPQAVFATPAHGESGLATQRPSVRHSLPNVVVDDALEVASPAPRRSPPNVVAAPSFEFGAAARGASSIPRELPMPMPAFMTEPGPTTGEALRAIRPRRWAALAVLGLIGVAVFGGLLWSELRRPTPGRAESLALSLIPPPLLSVPVDDEFVAFPKVAVLPRVDEPRVEEPPPPPAPVVVPSRRVEEPAPKSRSTPRTRPSPARTKGATQPDLLDAWQ